MGSIGARVCEVGLAVDVAPLALGFDLGLDV